jgi:hypothetical protein
MRSPWRRGRRCREERRPPVPETEVATEVVEDGTFDSECMTTAFA